MQVCLANVILMAIAMRHPRYDQRPGCPVEMCAEILGGKWKGLIVVYLLEGTKRFGDLQRLLPDVTQRTLTAQLRELEADGIIMRKVYAQVPPKVEYSMSELGETLRTVITMMRSWGADYLQQRAAVTAPPAPGSKATRSRING